MPRTTRRSKSDWESPARAAFLHMTTGPSWQWSPTSTSWRQPSTTGIMHSGSVACVLSSISTERNWNKTTKKLTICANFVHHNMQQKPSVWHLLVTNFINKPAQHYSTDRSRSTSKSKYIGKWRADSKFSNPAQSAAPAVVPQTTLTVQQKNFNRCAVVIEIYFMFMILCLAYVARAYTLTSTVGAIVQYCLRNQENLHISVRL